ncbi:MAG: hypothetical protein KC933_21935 [Myxococcales bacterium]|nr:hypothetical protein [Myxococcales bacterium]MCB9649708.1 hypothetical protein [Deltaproteobacteria bacterium]
MDRRVHTYAYVDRPYGVVRMAFAEELVDVLQHASEAAAARAVAVATTLHARLGPFDLGTRVQVDATGFEQTPPEAEHAMCRLHVRWSATRGKGLFPSMEADLVAHPVGDRETQLALFATYRPPLGAVGSLGDALIGHRLAEAALHRFLEEVVRRLEVMIPVDLGDVG